MIMRLTWGKIHPGKWQEFEQTYRATVATRAKNVKGLRGRWLVQDASDTDAGFAVSLWESEAEMQAYEQSALYKEVVTPLQPFFMGEYTTHRCEVKHFDPAT